MNDYLDANIDIPIDPRIKNNLTDSTIVSSSSSGFTLNKAVDKTVMFQKTDYLRIGSYTKKLNDYPELKAKLWDRLRNANFEDLYAKIDLEISDIIHLLNYPEYFRIKAEVMPTDPKGILYYLQQEKMVCQQDNGLYAITNLGAIALANDLANFPSIARKALRIVQFKGNNRLEMLKESNIAKGYVASFQENIKYLEAILPSSEQILESPLRKTVTQYPVLALREAIGNALIYQDFSLTGTGPVVEVFENRIEISNPGLPIIDIDRIIDNPPKSRNEQLASLMRRLRMCEELGTGWDKIVTSCECMELPPPKINLYEDSIKVTLFSYIPFATLSLEDKLRACYQHACLKQVSGEQLTNTSLRERFGLSASPSASSSISRLIRESVEHGLIKPLDFNTGNRNMKYIPFWA